MAPRDPRVTVGHVSRALLMRDRNEADAREREQVEGIHESGADNAEHVLDALRDKGFDKRFRRRHLLLADNRKRLGLGHGVHSDFLWMGHRKVRGRRSRARG